ncbi:Serine-protein kinase RsbW [invertebrate metagenome]|uniref:Serine-protein kinase RsbW n=1 Tax=invertebrate metagenome TaxID=1711999 RepID=A0A2H9T7V9_9ZZZZ
MANERSEKAVIALHMKSEHHHTALLSAAIVGICHQYEMSAKKIWQVELSVTECITNIIKHAYKSQAGNSINVTVAALKNGLEITLYDSGIPLPENILKIPVALQNKDLADLNIRGRGLYLVRTLMDSFKYTTTREGINQQVLFKTFS